MNFGFLEGRASRSWAVVGEEECRRLVGRDMGRGMVLGETEGEIMRVDRRPVSKGSMKSGVGRRVNAHESGVRGWRVGVDDGDADA